MATTSTGLWYPDAGVPFNWTVHAANMMNSVDTVIEKRANNFSGTDVERIAYTSKAKQGMLWSNTDGNKEVYQFRNGRWFPEYEFIELTNPNAVFKPMGESGLHVHSFGRFAVLAGVWKAQAAFTWTVNTWHTLGFIPEGYRPRFEQNLRDVTWGHYSGSTIHTSRVEMLMEVYGISGHASDGRFQVNNTAAWSDQTSPYSGHITVPGMSWPILQNT